MTLAQRVAAKYRRKALFAAVLSPYGDKSPQAAELNAIADVVEALDEAATGWPQPNKYDTALAKLAKAVGVEEANEG